MIKLKALYLWEHYPFSSETHWERHFTPYLKKIPNHTETVATCAQPWSCRIICLKRYAFTARLCESIFPPWSSTLNRFPVKLNGVTDPSVLHLLPFHPLISLSFSHFPSLSPSKSQIKSVTPSVFLILHSHWLYSHCPTPWTPFCFGIKST